ncbi:hypothetical protein EV175_000325 [Coemansia sp. RSA 1933]|nr:hypothetical protein EV175_000325 [Coemansia sp. RSA 1933]
MQNNDSRGHGVYGAFPSIAWPLNRTETGISHTGLDALNLGVLGGMLPTIDEDSMDTQVAWLPLSKPANRSQPHGILCELREPLVLRPPTRIPGFLKRSKALSQKDMVQQMQIICHDMDIPPAVVVDALEEASVDAMRESTSPFTGNAVGYCRPVLDYSATTWSGSLSKRNKFYRRSTMRHKMDVKPDLLGMGPGDDSNHGYRWSSSCEWALYPGGECSSELWAMPQRVDFTALQAQSEDEPTSEGQDAQPAMEFTTAIRQISVREAHPGFACVRTDSMAALIQVTQVCDATALNSHVAAELVGDPYSYDRGDQWTTYVSWSPWNISELALASGTGAVRLWDCSAGKQTELKTSDDMGAYGLQWNCCEYWNSPRHLLCANPDRAYYLDCRAGRSSLTSLLSPEKSEFAFDSERITAALPSALHPMHAVVASTHALRVFDQRYPEKPVVVWSLPHMQNDPPVYLHSTPLSSYEDGKAAMIFATSKESSQTFSFVYGQHEPGSPYVSLEQGMLKSATAVSTIRETIQDSLAIDPQENKDIVSAFAFSSDYPTAPLIGFAVCPAAHAKPQAEAKGSKPVYAGMACISVDELGKVVGHRLSVVSTTDRVLSSAIVRNKRQAGITISDNALIDSMGVVLQTKTSRATYMEDAWAGIRKRALAYQRVDMQDTYRYLVGGGLARAGSRNEPHNSTAASEIDSLADLTEVLSAILPTAASSRKTAFGIVSEILASLSVQKPRISTQLPSYSAVGKRLRKEFLLLKGKKQPEGGLLRGDPSAITRLIVRMARDHDSKPSNSEVKLACLIPALRALKELFGIKGTMRERDHRLRIAEDLVLSRIKVGPADTDAASSQQKRKRDDGAVYPESILPGADLGARVAELAGAAGTLRDTWDNSSLLVDTVPSRPAAPALRDSFWKVRSQKVQQSLRSAGAMTGGGALETSTYQVGTLTEPLASSNNSSTMRGIGTAAADVVPPSLSSSSPLPYLSTPTPAVFSQVLSQQHQRQTAPSQKTAKKKKKARRTGGF